MRAHSRHDLRTLPAALLTLALSTPSLFSCSSHDGDGSSLPNGNDAEPAFLLGTRVWDDASTTSYFQVSRSLEAGTRVGLDSALEVAGAAKLFAVEGLGWFAIGEAETPVITRYTLGENTKLVKGDSVSLHDHGVSGLWDTLYVVSPTKMYYPDRAGRQLIIINPTEMKVSGTVDLSATARDGYLSLYSYAHLTRGKQIVFSVAWIDWEETDSVLAETGLVVVDTENDQLTRFDVDDRCGGVTQAITTSNGDSYFASSGLAAAAHRLGRLDSEPCALRVRQGEDHFDGDYLLKLGKLSGEPMIGEPVSGPDNRIFLRAFDETLADVAVEETWTWNLTGQSAWRWLEWNVETDAIEPVDTLEPSTADVVWFKVDGRVFGTESKPDYSETTLIELTAKGGPRRALTAPGFLHAVARIR